MLLFYEQAKYNLEHSHKTYNNTKITQKSTKREWIIYNLCVCARAQLTLIAAICDTIFFVSSLHTVCRAFSVQTTKKCTTLSGREHQMRKKHNCAICVRIQNAKFVLRAAKRNERDVGFVFQQEHHPWSMRQIHTKCIEIGSNKTDSG